MKRLILFLPLSLLSLGLSAQFVDSMDHQGNWKGLLLNSGIDSLQDQNFIAEKGPFKLYSKSTDQMILEGEKVNSIKYLFFRGHLFGIFCFSDEAKRTEIIYDRIKEKFDDPDVENLDHPRFKIVYWKSEEQVLQWMEEINQNKALIMFFDRDLLDDIYEEDQNKQYLNHFMALEWGK